MAVGERRPLEIARRVATRFGQELAPFCDRIEIAGSIRRAKPDIADIEMVCIPKTRQEEGPPPDLFSPPPTIEVNQVWEAIEAMGTAVCLPIKLQVSQQQRFADAYALPVWPERDPHWHRKRLKNAARYFKLLLPRSGFKVDLFLATPETWGVTLAIRTGSSEFSRALVTRWTRISGGGHSKEGQLHDRDGRIVPTPEERDVFQACKLRYIAPPLRIDASSLEALA